MAGLTNREREVLDAIARGRSNPEIAADLFLSEATVKTHVGHLLAKTGRRDRVALVILAYGSGLTTRRPDLAERSPHRRLDGGPPADGRDPPQGGSARPVGGQTLES